MKRRDAQFLLGAIFLGLPMRVCPGVARARRFGV